MKPWKTPTPDQLAHGWIQPDTSMRLCFAYYAWQVHFRPSGEVPPTIQQESLWMSHATTACSLMNIRTLDSFFGDAEPRQEGDMVAAWWTGEKVGKPFLTPAERKTISRVIAHHTVDQIKQLAPHRWDVRDMVRRAFERYADFVAFICRAHLSPDSPAAEVMRQRVQAHKRCLDDWMSRGVPSPEWRAEHSTRAK